MFRQLFRWEIISPEAGANLMRTLALISVLLVSVPLISQNEPGGVSGVILSPDGKPIEGAFILIRVQLKADPHRLLLRR